MSDAEKDARLIKVLVSNSSKGKNAKKHERAVKEMLPLARIPANAKAFRDAGALPALRSVLSSDSEAAGKCAAEVLETLALCGRASYMLEEIMVAGIIPVLPGRVTAPRSPASEAALQALGAVARDIRNCQDACREAGVLPRLPALLHGPGAQLWEAHLVALGDLCDDNEESQRAALELQPSIARSLVAQLSVGSVNHRGLAAATIPRVLSTPRSTFPHNPAWQAAFLAAGAPQPLMALLRSPVYEVRNLTAVAISTLLSVEGQSVFSAAVVPIVRMASVEEGQLRKHCLKTMGDLALEAPIDARHPGNQAALRAAGGLELALSHIMADDPELARTSLSAVRGIAYHANQDALLAAGAIPLIVKAISRVIDVHYNGFALNIVRDLVDSGHEASIQALLAAGAPAAVWSSLKTDTDRFIQRTAAEALVQLHSVVDDDTAASILADVVDLAKTSAHNRQAAAVHCLRFMWKTSPQLLDDGTLRAVGIIPVLLSTLVSGTQRAKAAACRLLHKLAESGDGPGACEEIAAAEGGIQALKRMLEEIFFEARGSAAIALGHLAGHGHSAAVLGVEGCILALLALLPEQTKKEVDSADWQAVYAL